MIIPSLDLIGGKAVQLKNGKEKILERENPLEIAEHFGKFGELAVIDLDAALGNKEDNLELIRKVCTLTKARVGGGIRSLEKAKKVFSYGAGKIIIGTSAFKDNKINHDFLTSLKLNIGKQHIIIAIDSYEGEIVTKGWKHKTGIDTLSILKELEEYCHEFLLTITEKEGCMQGTDISFIEKVKKNTKNHLTVAGGISSLKEIKELSKLDVDLQLGMAIYSGEIKIEDAFMESLNWDKSQLIPTIVKNERDQVLMLAYSNKESLQKTFETKKATYFSRSRNTLWTKGETSGNLQEFLSIRTDCDRDTLLLKVKQKGVACHLQRYSCFDSEDFSLKKLYEIITNRFENPKEGSYTSKLLKGNLLKEKILEEAKEVCSAIDYDNKVWEVADLLYFLVAYMAKEKIDFSEVYNELQRRNRK